MHWAVAAAEEAIPDELGAVYVSLLSGNDFDVFEPRA
jgi:hypothetical protein